MLINQKDEIYVRRKKIISEAPHLLSDMYLKSSNTSRLEAHVGLFRLLMEGILGP